MIWKKRTNGMWHCNEWKTNHSTQISWKSEIESMCVQHNKIVSVYLCIYIAFTKQFCYLSYALPYSISNKNENVHNKNPTKALIRDLIRCNVYAVKNISPSTICIRIQYVILFRMKQIKKRKKRTHKIINK